MLVELPVLGSLHEGLKFFMRVEESLFTGILGVADSDALRGFSNLYASGNDAARMAVAGFFEILVSHRKGERQLFAHDAPLSLVVLKQYV